MGNVLRLGIARVGLAVNQWRTNRCLSKKTIVILILGLQEVGKSTIALRLWKLRKTLPDAHYVQTKGFNTYEIRKKKITVRLHDLGGHESIRELWEHYYADAHGVIFVVDSTKPDEAVEAGDVLTEVLRDERMQRKPVLVLLNKQDLPNAAKEVDLTKTMELLSIANSARCFTRVDACAAMDLKDTAIFDGFKWLQTYIETQYADMNHRVQHDSTIEREKEKAKFDLRRNEVRRIREQTLLAVQRDENKHNNTTDDEVDEGIEEVQKPAEVTSIDGDNNIETIPPSATPALISTVKAKKLQEQMSTDKMMESRLSPEGAVAADNSTEDILTNVNSSVPSNTSNTNLITNINNNNNNHNNNNNININSQSFIKSSNPPNPHNSNSNTDIIQLNHTPSNTKSNHSNSSTSVKPYKNGHQRRQSRVINTPPSRNGHDNPAFEHNEDYNEQTTTLNHSHHNRSNSSSSSHRIIMDKKFSNSKLPIRSSAISIRSNSTETDIEIPGEIILVTTKAEVHETQEMTDDYNKSELKDYEPNDHLDQNVSPISYLSGHISHRTSQDSIASAVLVVNTDSVSEIIEQNDKSRASSANLIHSIEQNNHTSKAKPTPLQKLVNIKSRNKTAPINGETMEDQLNGNAIKMKKTESATNHNNKSQHRTADIS